MRTLYKNAMKIAKLRMDRNHCLMQEFTADSNGRWAIAAINFKKAYRSAKYIQSKLSGE